MVAHITCATPRNSLKRGLLRKEMCVYFCMSRLHSRGASNSGSSECLFSCRFEAADRSLNAGFLFARRLAQPLRQKLFLRIAVHR